MSDDKPLGAGGPWKDPADEQKRADETTQTIARAMAEIAVRDLSTFYIDPCRGDDAMGAPGDRTRPFKTMPSLTHLSGGLHYNVEVIPCAGPFPCSCGQRSARNLPTVVTSSVAGLVDITADAQRVCIEILRADLARSERYALRDADERDALKKANEALRSDLNLVKDKLGLVYLASADDIIICIGERQTERAQALAEARMLRAEVEELRSAVAAVCSTLGVGDGWTTGGIASRVTAMNQQRVAALQQLEAVNERICIPKDSTWSAQLNAIIQLHEKYEDVTGALHSLMDRDKESIRGSERYALRDAEECKALKEENRRFLGKIEQQDARARATIHPNNCGCWPKPAQEKTMNDETTKLRWEVGQVWSCDGLQWRVDAVQEGPPRLAFLQLQSAGVRDPVGTRTMGRRIEDYLRRGWFIMTPEPIAPEAQQLSATTIAERLDAEAELAAHEAAAAGTTSWMPKQGREKLGVPAGLVDITADAQRVCIEILRADLARLKDALVIESRAKVMALDECERLRAGIQASVLSQQKTAAIDALIAENEKLRAHIRAINQRLDLPPDAGAKEAMRVIFEKMERDKESIRGSERYALRDAEERDSLRVDVARLESELSGVREAGRQLLLDIERYKIQGGAT